VEDLGELHVLTDRLPRALDRVLLHRRLHRGLLHHSLLPSGLRDEVRNGLGCSGLEEGHLKLAECDLEVLLAPGRTRMGAMHGQANDTTPTASMRLRHALLRMLGN